MVSAVFLLRNPRTHTHFITLAQRAFPVLFCGTYVPCLL